MKIGSRIAQVDAASSTRNVRTNRRSSDVRLPALDPSQGTPAEIWDNYFTKQHPTSQEVSRNILKLHNAKRYKHVIAAIQAALIHGKSQPWMYDVLAMSMQLDKRPAEDIERVLLSRVDFTAVDVPNMLLSAAYLKRFGAERQSLKMYRQASRLAPNRPEPYILGLRTAKRLNDHDAIGWAAAGILTTAWQDGFEQLHREARDVAARAGVDLRKAGQNKAADRLAQTIKAALKRDLVLQLTWSGNGDLDLVVEEPFGTECSLENRYSAGGGVLVHDGFGPKQKNCHEDYVCAFGAPGDYQIHVRYAWGNIVGKRARLSIIQNQGTDHEIKKVITVPVSNEGHIVVVNLKDGRRKLPMRTAPQSNTSTESYKLPERTRWNRLMTPAARRTAYRLHKKQGWNVLAQQQQQRILTGNGIGVNGLPGNPNQIGFQPVITNIPSGSSLQTTATVSADRRYVRITARPVFSTLTDVFTFSFVNGGVNGNAGNGAGVIAPNGN